MSSRLPAMNVSSALQESRNRAPRTPLRVVAESARRRPACQGDAVEDDDADRGEVADPRDGIAGDQHEVGALSGSDLPEVGIVAGEEAGVVPGSGAQHLGRRETRLDELPELQMEARARELPVVDAVAAGEEPDAGGVERAD